MTGWSNHNPEVDWKRKIVKFIRCPSECQKQKKNPDPLVPEMADKGRRQGTLYLKDRKRSDEEDQDLPILEEMEARTEN